MTGSPLEARYSLTWRMLKVRKWNTEAASTAVACPCSTASKTPARKAWSTGAGHGVPATSRGCPRWMRPMPWGAAYKRIENYGL